MASIKELDVTVIEDINCIEETWSDDNITNAKIRQISTCLRRLLIDGSLGQCARNFQIKLNICSPDIKWIVNSIPKCDITFFQSVGAKCFGIEMSVFAEEKGGQNLFKYMPEGWNPDRFVFLKLDDFLSQKVLYFNGKFIQRREVIKYVCNKAGGTHFDNRRENDSFEILDKIRNSVLITKKDNMPQITLNFDSSKEASREFVFRKDHIDPVFLTVYGICNFLMQSESVKALREKFAEIAA